MTPRLIFAVRKMSNSEQKCPSAMKYVRSVKSYILEHKMELSNGAYKG